MIIGGDFLHRLDAFLHSVGNIPRLAIGFVCVDEENILLCIIIHYGMMIIIII